MQLKIVVPDVKQVHSHTIPLPELLAQFGQGAFLDRPLGRTWPGCRVPVGCRYILVTITMEPLVVRKLMLPSVMTMFLPCNGALRTGHVASGDELAAAKAKPFWLGYTSHQGQAVFASALSPCVFGKVPLKKLVDSAYVAANK